MPIERITPPLNEGSSRIIDFNVLDEDGEIVPAANITQAQLTLCNLELSNPDGSPAIVRIINNRDDQNVLNTNNVTVSDSTAKLVTWTMQPADNRKPSGLTEEEDTYLSRRTIWRHLATFHFEFTTGEYNYQIEIEVRNMKSIV